MNHISYMASVTVHTSAAALPAESFPQAPEQAAEAAVVEQIKPQLIGRLLVGDEDPVPPVGWWLQ